MDWDQIERLISAVGFPIVVALWFMLRTDKRLDRVIQLFELTLLNTPRKSRQYLRDTDDAGADKENTNG